MKVFYNGKLIKNNEFLKVSETQIKPEIKINVNKTHLYTLIMFDPDAINGTFIHWTIVNISNNDINSGNDIISYKGPSPPAKTGRHRYIFHLYKQDGENIIGPINEKVFEYNTFKKKLNIDNQPIFKIQFISENESGGKRKRKTKRRYNKTKKNNKNNKSKKIY